MKMYIILHSQVPDKLASVIAAHASLACYKKLEQDQDMAIWIDGVFRKVVCVVDEGQFEELKTEPKNIVLTESSLGGEEVCLAFCPRESYPKKFKFLKMWTPQHLS